MRLRINKRRMLARLLAVAAAAAVIVGLSVTPALADSTPAPTASSDAIESRPGTIRVDVQGDGLVGLILGGLHVTDLLRDLLSGVANAPAAITGTLTSALFGPMAAHAPAAGVLASSGYQFNGAETIDPAAGTPAGCSVSSSTCYSTLALGGGANTVSSLVGLKLGLAHGIVQNVDQGNGTQVLTAQSEITHLGLSLLGAVQVIDVGAISSISQCSSSFGTDGTPSTTSTGVLTANVLGAPGGPGLVSLSLAADGSVLDATIAGKSLTLGPQSISIAGLNTTVRLDGHLLRATVNLSSDGLLAALGLGGLSGLVHLLSDVTVQLDLGIGSLSSNNGGNTSGSGLAVQAGLSANVALLGGVVKLTIGNGSGDASLGNLLDLRLANTNCSATGSVPSTNTWILPGLT